MWTQARIKWLLGLTLLAGAGVAPACSTEMMLDTLFSAEQEAVPEVPAWLLLVRVEELVQPTVTVLDEQGRQLEVQVEGCSPAIPPDPCADVPGAGAGSLLIHLPGDTALRNLRVIATQGARSFRAIMPEICPMASVREGPTLVDGGVLNLETTAVSLLIEAKAWGSGLGGVSGLPAATVAHAKTEILARLARGDEAIKNYFDLIADLDDHFQSMAGGPVLVTPTYTTDYQPAAGGSSALNPAFIAQHPYAKINGRQWDCMEEEARTPCPAPDSCTDGETLKFTCPGVKRLQGDTAAFIQLDWCTCKGQTWECRDGIADWCPAAIEDQTTREYQCSGAAGNASASAFKPACTFHSYCGQFVKCTLGCKGDAACQRGCQNVVMPAPSLSLAEELLECAAAKDCVAADDPVACLRREDTCPDLFRICNGGRIVCELEERRDCTCDDNRQGQQECRNDQLGWTECACGGAHPVQEAPALRGEWKCFADPQVQCVTPVGECDGRIGKLNYVCPATRPGQDKSQRPLVDWCTCGLVGETEQFDQVIAAAARSFEFTQICFADTDITEDSDCFRGVRCALACAAGDQGCITGCTEQVPAGRRGEALGLLSCVQNQCVGQEDWKGCAADQCATELQSCKDADGVADTCYGQRCYIRSVFTTNFKNGLKDGACNTLNVYKWTAPGPGPMHFTGGFHKSDTLTVSAEERTAINQLLGNWIPNIVRMYDDGTHGDLSAGDNIWTIVFDLPLGMRMGYKYTYGPDGNGWSPTEEWPGNQHILVIKDYNGDHFVTRHDNYGDEASNKDVQNLNPRVPAGTLDWDFVLDPSRPGELPNPPAAAERQLWDSQTCSLAGWSLLSNVAPLMVPCPGQEGGE